MTNKDFNTIWQKRLSSNPEDQAQLYLAIEAIFKRSRYYYFYNQYDREDFFSQFYTEKILLAIHHKKAITEEKYDHYGIALIFKMLERYHNDCFRKEQKNPITEQTRIDIHTFEGTIPLEGMFKVLYVEEVEQLFEPVECPLPCDEMVAKAVQFFHFSDDWVYILLLNYFEGKPHKTLPKDIKSSYSKAAKLGVIAKGSHYRGATSYHDYHTETLIGEWIADAYGDEFIPVTHDFLIIIFKTLRRAALSIKENGENSNDTEN